MPTTSFVEYAHDLRALLDEALAAGDIVRFEFQVDQRSVVRGLVTGDVEFASGDRLHFREFLDMTRSQPRLMYVYHCQNVEAELIFRYDNAVHRPPLFHLEHKHTPGQVTTSPAPSMSQVLDEILSSVLE